MHDGEQLRELLTKHGKRPKDLETAMGKSRQMLHRYFSMPKFTPNIRQKIQEGLELLQIDATILDEAPGSIMDPDELRGLLNRIPPEALRDLKRMLECDRAAKVALIALISDRLERKR